MESEEFVSNQMRLESMFGLGLGLHVTQTFGAIISLIYLALKSLSLFEPLSRVTCRLFL